jgi:chlorite dismutase
MADPYGTEAPETLEGWYVLHDAYVIDWPGWRSLPPAERQGIAEEGVRWMREAAGTERGDSTAYSLVGQRGDLLFVHYRSSPAEVNRVELSLRQIGLYDWLIPAWSYLSVIEMGMYELTAMVRMRLADQDIQPGSDEYEAYFESEMRKQHRRAESRLFRDIPVQEHICVYPMNKRRGESVNWYSLTIEERRELMRGHGRIGHKFHKKVTQIIGGAVGLDDWEWVVSLHADDPLTFKKLVYEMRFDPASALYAEFGPFHVGLRIPPAGIAELLDGRLPEHVEPPPRSPAPDEDE